MNQTQEAPVTIGPRTKDKSSTPDGYEPRQHRGSRGDAVLGVVQEERRSRASRRAEELDSGEYPQAVYRNDRIPSHRSEPDLEGQYAMAAGQSFASHPLFQGLVQELPPRNDPPSAEWLDQWTSTARSILDLLYSRGHGA
ncbi:MAG TPA: hypothetical protein H9902_10465 [Candidatus Stackebrandtia faecavium]|nr:hypothetical protein [Candidatus Stackebrandtia faecavium]